MARLSSSVPCNLQHKLEIFLLQLTEIGENFEVKNKTWNNYEERIII